MTRTMLPTSPGARLLVFAGVLVAIVALSTERGEAHKPITSKYTYNDDVFPILHEKCSRCHVAGGVAPMSLMTYQDAFPWAESIRAELIASHMPPWNADPSVGAFKHASLLTAREIDVVLTWATGGNPEGNLEHKPPPVTLENDWRLGAPDLKLPLPEFALAADKMEDTTEFTIPVSTTQVKWVRAVDLLPGTPSIVRSALIYVKGTPAADGSGAQPEQVLARWVPGLDLEPMDHGAAYTLPAGAQLGVRVHYKKTWQFEGQALKDQSTVGIYLTVKRAQPLMTLAVVEPAGTAPAGKQVTFSRTVDADVEALAVSPDQVPPNISLEMDAIKPDGSRTPMLKLNTRADWDRQYWFQQPIALPRGTKLAVVANLEDPDLLSSALGTTASSAPKAPRAAGPMRLALDVVPVQAGPRESGQ